MEKIHQFKQKIQPLADYPSHSRVHSLKTFSNTLTKCYVKRDDELGFGISGSKVRKYLSLLPYLLQHQVEEVIIIGGANSNHVLGLTQLAIENNIQPRLFLLGNETQPTTGNYLLTSMMVTKEYIHWISRQDWPEVTHIANTHATQQTIHKTAVIPEGACMPAALAGALTLALDILRNETEQQLQFNDLFIDAGTGLTAIALILAYTWLQKQTCIHVLLLADTPEIFLEKLQQFCQHFELLFKVKLAWPEILQHFKLHIPQQARSFGATNAKIFNRICTIASTEGFITDPIYSVKLFIESQQIIANQALTGNILIIHSGGGLGLMGYQDYLLKAVQQSLEK